MWIGRSSTATWAPWPHPTVAKRSCGPSFTSPSTSAKSWWVRLPREGYCFESSSGCLLLWIKGESCGSRALHTCLDDVPKHLESFDFMLHAYEWNSGFHMTSLHHIVIKHTVCVSLCFTRIGGWASDLSGLITACFVACLSAAVSSSSGATFKLIKVI